MGKLEQFKFAAVRIPFPHKGKQYKGEIHNWEIRRFDKNRHPGYEDTLGYVIFGKPKGHPSFTGWIVTSAVVKHDPLDNEIETMNSYYKLIGEGREGKMI
jgi:hypothetical protein